MIWKIHTYRWIRRKSKNEEKVDAYRYYIGMDVYIVPDDVGLLNYNFTFFDCVGGLEYEEKNNHNLLNRRELQAHPLI